MPVGTWADACRALVEGADTRTVEIIEGLGNDRLLAELRLRAAGRLVARGRVADAQKHLAAATAFFSKVGATVHLGEADEVLAAAS
jgi:hypothetical protein